MQISMNGLHVIVIAIKTVLEVSIFFLLHVVFRNCHIILNICSLPRALEQAHV